MKILAISILIFCVVTVSSKPWLYGYMDSHGKDVNLGRRYPLQHTTLTSEPTFPEWVQSHSLQNEIQDNTGNKINEKIEDNVRNEIDDNAENMPPPEKIILTNEDIK
ncbi:uncharacterized protein LOC105288112 isoform X2 [Ooceraea biroi]|uniref:uncharacterized protein LOC105288112 isoform X2 n=1 Tax=Ooceraea biroi TaxID=2015173 RepID=UPI0005B952F3|nr:uncharacterized protein LOC105288112 isoform X2 [Ooceraea biroi]